LYAPIKKGQQLGNVVYKQGNKVLGEEKLLANADIDKLKDPQSITQIIIENFRYILKNL
jgi:hypothetical protein